MERYFASDKKTVKNFVSAKVYSPDAPKFFKQFKKMFVKYFSNTKSQTNIAMTDQVMIIANANLWWLAPDQQAYLSTLPAGKNPAATEKKVRAGSCYCCWCCLLLLSSSSSSFFF